MHEVHTYTHVYLDLKFRRWSLLVVFVGGSISCIQQKNSYDVLRNLIYMEFQNNKDKNSEFLVSDDIDKKIKKYLDEKIYSSEIGDIIANILANSTSTEAHIYKRNKENEFLQTNLIEPRGPAANGDVHLLKSGEYYEPIVPRSFIGLHK